MATDTAVDVVMPQMGVSVSEGTVTKWMKSVGDTVEADETLLEISTDKVDTEVPSPISGVVLEILVQEGQTVVVGTPVARLGAVGSATTAAPPTPPAEELPAAELPATLVQAASVAAFPESEQPASVAPTQVPSTEPADGAAGGNGAGDHHTFISPVVARIAHEHGLDPTKLSGTGRDGRVTKSDILAFVEAGGTTVEPAPASEPPATPAAVTPVAETPVEPASAPPAPPIPPPVVPTAAPAAPAPTPVAPPTANDLEAGELEAGETLTPMTPMRRGIAEHMRRSLDTSAHVTSAIEVDMSKVAAIREKLKDEYKKSYGVNPTYLAFIARATVETLRDWPLVNAEIRGDAVLTRTFANLGFAVSLDGGRGLIVPVLKHAEGLNLLGMARGIADLAERARTKKLLPDDVQGGTFTITNPGGYGTFIGTPIISQPQSAILGTYAVVKRPWVITDDAGHDAIGIRPMMNLTLTYDHRLVDGAYGAQVLRDLADRLQSWGESDY